MSHPAAVSHPLELLSALTTVPEEGFSELSTMDRARSPSLSSPTSLSRQHSGSANHLPGALTCPTFRLCNLVAKLSMGHVTLRYLHNVANFFPAMIPSLIHPSPISVSVFGTAGLSQQLIRRVEKAVGRVRQLERLGIVQPEMIRALTFPLVRMAVVPGLNAYRAVYASTKKFLQEMSSSTASEQSVMRTR